MVEREKRGRWKEKSFSKEIIEGYIVGHPGKCFSIRDLRNMTELSVSSVTFYRIMDEFEKENLVERLTAPNKRRKYRSLASPLSPPIVTQEEDEDNDSLGRQARESFYADVNRFGGSSLIHIIRKF